MTTTRARLYLKTPLFFREVGRFEQVPDGTRSIFVPNEAPATPAEFVGHLQRFQDNEKEFVFKGVEEASGDAIFVLEQKDL